MFPYKSTPPQTQPEKAAVHMSFVHEVGPNRNGCRTKKYNIQRRRCYDQKNKNPIPTSGAYSDLPPAVP